MQSTTLMISGQILLHLGLGLGYVCTYSYSYIYVGIVFTSILTYSVAVMVWVPLLGATFQHPTRSILLQNCSSFNWELKY